MNNNFQDFSDPAPANWVKFAYGIILGTSFHYSLRFAVWLEDENYFDLIEPGSILWDISFCASFLPILFLFSFLNFCLKLSGYPIINLYRNNGRVDQASLGGCVIGFVFGGILIGFIMLIFRRFYSF